MIRCHWLMFNWLVIDTFMSVYYVTSTAPQNEWNWNAKAIIRKNTHTILLMYTKKILHLFHSQWSLWKFNEAHLEHMNSKGVPAMRDIQVCEKINHVAFISFSVYRFVSSLGFYFSGLVFTNNIFIRLSSVGKDPILTNAFCEWCHLTINIDAFLFR